ncbi:hypothetical protein GCM10023185_06760 [Hymenobacter saemangeumensis]|uniref:Translation initiation factor IF-2 N-terminal domain-containing protein n=1 Tax=Hymenobacter saemangeumensis TaxID=1084522 RepID=A0ABP8I263_9BACT
MKTVISAGQSLVDVALQELGTVEALFDLADAAGLGITDVLSAGQSLEVPASPAALADVAAYFADRSQRINTASEPAPVPAPALSNDFDHNDFTPTDFY